MIYFLADNFIWILCAVMGAWTAINLFRIHDRRAAAYVNAPLLEALRQPQVNWRSIFEIEREVYIIPHHHRQTPGAPDWLGDGPPDWWETERQQILKDFSDEVDEALALTRRRDPLDEAFEIIEKKMVQAITGGFLLPRSPAEEDCHWCGISAEGRTVRGPYCDVCYPKRSVR